MSDSVLTKLEHALKADCRLIVITTTEDERAMQCAGEVCNQLTRKCEFWQESVGFSSSLPPAITQHIEEATTGKLIAFPFVDRVLDTKSALTIIARRLDAVFSLKGANGRRPTSILRSYFCHPNPNGTTLIFIADPEDVPAELRSLAHFIDLPLPRQKTLQKVLGNVISKLKTERPGDDSLAALTNASLGMTAFQAERAFSLAYVKNGAFNDDAIQSVTEQKQQIIKQSEALEYIPWEATVPESDVAGLDVLKRWLKRRRVAFSNEAEAFGLRPPKGILLVGVPGTGKSLAAKMVGRLWRQPLLRLDMGALFNKYVGESEKRTREALRLAETISPCILWIDEIEKGIDSNSGERDGGSSQRMLGTLLTWMQDRQAPVFVVATANRVDRLPPELKRSGRFDQIFRIDLPRAAERHMAFNVHLAKLGQSSKEGYGVTAMEEVIAASKGFTGAEIEQAVKEAVVDAFIVDDIRLRAHVTPAQLLKQVQLLRPIVAERARNCSSIELDFAISASNQTGEEYENESNP